MQQRVGGKFCSEEVIADVIAWSISELVLVIRR